MWQCVGNVSACLNSSMASASCSQCFCFSFCPSVLLSGHVCCLSVASDKVLYVGPHPESPADLGLQCRLLLLLFLLILEPVKAPRVLQNFPLDTFLGVPAVWGVLTLWLGLCSLGWKLSAELMAQAEQSSFSHFIMSWLGWSHHQRSFVLASQ